ncbi:putative O-linked N-acetylglucosamine transferase (SPINDLY family) [Paraburkholderia eburnea]|uniref:protein O-GlcNAc transferase n=1 Tax=Paraburkholderia eburnea TaxID=1189126 RepID=A0A2S4M511_9BURK|nr:putative O-linked N-acetylglucosamine transferase (SPINDLY family) [Paraburkholderia eburnea]PRZ20222.1 putative O-linked N-acetylglucosamine transferase (SPINDLY family) [Paraburkholderia eburnea]
MFYPEPARPAALRHLHLKRSTQIAVENEYALKVLLACRGQLALTDLVEYANRIGSAGLNDLAVVLYRAWLEHTDSPHKHLVWFNLGATYNEMGRLDDAKQAYKQSIELAPAFVQPRVSLGTLYERMGQPDAALAEWTWVARTTSDHDPINGPLRLLTLNNLGRLSEAQRKFADAKDWLGQSLALRPAQTDVLQHWAYLRARTCSWPVYAPWHDVDVSMMRASTSALAKISQTDDPAEQLAAARRYVEEKVDTTLPALADGLQYGHRKLRIGYLSSDYSLHPVSMLMVELFELHNRNDFEVYGYCWSPEDGSALRQRVIRSFDHYFRIDKLSDAEAARLIREHEIDILIDLQGQTAGARAHILAARPAPLQITYLGLPATTGFPFIDYVIADEYLIPPVLAPHYSEKMLYMPDVYQVSDRQRVIAPLPSRASCGLPETGTVFCSFNNNYKITPEMFDVWSNILRRVPGSVLWLLSDNQWAEANLRSEALARGIEPERLVFATRASSSDFLARMAIADVFLDTFPFNAGTTANDALWAGLPVLTRVGRAFASRMAGALLTAAGLPELITDNVQDYEDKAVALAEAPQERLRLREALARVKAEGVLFDTPRFARTLEQKFKELVAALPRRAEAA